MNDERKTYNRDMTTARDTYNQIVYAEEKGREEGEREKAVSIARKMLEMSIDVNTIAIAAGLTSSENRIAERH